MPGALPVPRFWWWPAAWLPPADRRADHALPRGQVGCRTAGWRSHRERSSCHVRQDGCARVAAAGPGGRQGTHGTRRRSGRGVQQLVRSFACHLFTARSAPWPMTRGCAFLRLARRSLLPASPATAGRRTSGASRPASWRAGWKAATPACSSSSAASAAIIPTWLTPRSPRGCSGSAGRTRWRQALPRMRTISGPEPAAQGHRHAAPALAQGRSRLAPRACQS